MNLWGIIKGLLIQEESDRTKQLSVEVDSAATTGTKTVLKSSQTVNRTIDLPDATDTLVGKDTVDLLKNKQLEDSSTEIVDSVDNTKKLILDASGDTSTSTTLVTSQTVSNKTITLPDATDTLVGKATTDVLTNKSIDGANNTVTNVDGDNVIVDAISGLTATDVQAAIAEHQGEIDVNTTDIGTNTTNIGTNTTNIGTNTTNIGTNTTNIGTNTTNIGTNTTDIGNLQTDKEDVANKGVANGYASLDVTGKVPASELPANLMQFKGNWDASSNTPSLSDTDSDVQGDTYRTSVAGTVEFGGGVLASEISQLTDDSLTGITSGVGGTSNVFTTVGSFDLSQIDLNIFSAGSTGTYDVHIYGVTGGSEPDPTNVIASITGNDATALQVTATVESFVLGSPVTLSAATEYAVVIDARNTSGNNIAVRYSGANPYAGGLMYNTTDFTTWLQQSGGVADMYFNLYSGGGVSNSLTFQIGDWVYSDGSVWLKGDNIDQVTSVNAQNGVVILDADDISDAATTNKFALQTQLDKVDFVSVTQAVDLDTIESDTITNNAKVSAGGSIDINSDVDVTTVAPVLKDILEFDGTNWVPVVNSGSGQGSINYIKNPDLELNVDDITVTAQITKAVIGSPIRGTQSARITVLNSATTADYFEFDMNDTDLFDAGRKLNVSFEYRTFSNYTADDLQVVLRNLDSGLDIPIYNDNDGKIQPSLTVASKFQGSVYIDDVDNTYALRFKVLNSPTLSSIIDIDSVKVGPEEFAPGAIVTEFQAFTPTGLWASNITYTGQWRRVGDVMEVNAKIDFSGAQDAGSLTLNIPFGLSIDTNKLPQSIAGFDNVDSVTTLVDTSTGGNYSGRCNYDSPTSLFVGAFKDTAVATAYESVTGIQASSIFTIASGDYVTVNFKVPIAGWKASNLISTTETLFSTAKVAVNLAGNFLVTSTGNVRVPFDNVITDSLGLADTGASEIVIVKTGVYKVGSFAALTAVDTGNSYNLFIQVNGVTKARVGTTPSTTNILMSIPDRTMTLNVGDVVTAVVNSPGDASYFVLGGGDDFYLQVEQLPDHTIFGVQGITELIETRTAGFVWSSSGGSSGLYGDVLALPLPVGEWDLTFNAAWRHNVGSGLGVTDIAFGISTTIGTTFPDRLDGENAIPTTSNGASSFEMGNHTLPVYRVIVSTPTTYYLKCISGIVNSNLNISGTKMSARRVK